VIKKDTDDPDINEYINNITISRDNDGIKQEPDPNR